MIYAYSGVIPYLEITPEENQHLKTLGLSAIAGKNNKNYLHLADNPIEIEKLILAGFSVSTENDPLSFYELKGKYKTLFSWQADMVRLGVTNWRFYLPGFMSTGKTLVSYIIIDLLMTHQVVNKTLIVTTNSGMDDAWLKERVNAFLHRTVVFLTGNRKKRLQKLMANADVVVTNIDSIPRLEKELSEYGFDLILVDESHTVKNPESNRTIALATLVRTCRTRAMELYGHTCRIGLETGTPTAYSVADLRGQAMVAGFGDKEKWFYSEETGQYHPDFSWYDIGFVAEYCTTVGMMITDKPEKVDEVIQLVQPAYAPPIVDVLAKMPEQREYFIECPMTEEHQKTYDKMRENMYAEVPHTETGELVYKAITNPLNMAMQLTQIASGFMYDPQKPEDAHFICPQDELTAKEQWIVDYINNHAKSGVLILAKHTAAVERIRQILVKYCLNAEIKTFASKRERSGLIRWFNKNDSKLKVLVSQYARIAESVNLQEGGTTIYFSAVFKPATFIQSLFRIRRVSNKKPFVNTVFLYASELERRQQKKLLNKFERLIKVQKDMIELGKTQFHIPAVVGGSEDGVAELLSSELSKKDTEKV